MYSLHLAGALVRAEDPREARNRAHLLAIREARYAERRSVQPLRPSIQIQRIAVGGGSTSLSTDFDAVSRA